MAPKIVVHHLDNAASQKVLFCLEEIGLDYEVRKWRRENVVAPVGLKEFHPLGKAPIVQIDGKSLAESGLIVEYLCDTYGPQLKPASTDPLNNDYKYWLYYSGALAIAPILLTVCFNKLPSFVPFFLWPPVAFTCFLARNLSNGMLKDHADFLESSLAAGGGPWFLGEQFTGADVALSFVGDFHAANLPGGLPPRLAAWLQRVRERPAYKRALERGGLPYGDFKL